MSAVAHYGNAKIRLAAIIGYALFLTLTASVLWGGYIPMILQYRYTESITGLDFATRWTVFPLSFLFVGFLIYLHPRIIQSLSSTVPLFFLLSGGLLMFAAVVMPNHTEVFVVVIGACFSVGSALFFVFWTDEIAAQSGYFCGIIVIVAAALSPAIHFLVTLLPPPSNMFVQLLILAPICSLLHYYVRQHTNHRDPPYQSVPREQTGTIRKATQQLWRPIFCIASVGFMVGFVRSLTSSDAVLLELFNTISMLALFVSCIVLFVIWRFFRYQINLDNIYKLSFPLAATCFLLLPFLGGDFMLPIVIISFLLFNVVSALMVITCVQTAQTWKLQPTFVYSLTAGLVYLASSVGSAVGVVSGNTGFGFTQLLVLALVLFYVFAVLLFLPQHQRMLTSRAKTTKATAGQSTADIVLIQCKELQQRFGLSDREFEVTVLMARGRDVPHIASTLFISPNTVRSHSKNIFRKLDIHTKQEFLDLVEDCTDSDATRTANRTA